MEQINCCKRKFFIWFYTNFFFCSCHHSYHLLNLSLSLSFIAPNNFCSYARLKKYLVKRYRESKRACRRVNDDDISRDKFAFKTKLTEPSLPIIDLNWGKIWKFFSLSFSLLISTCVMIIKMLFIFSSHINNPPII